MVVEAAEQGLGEIVFVVAGGQTHIGGGAAAERIVDRDLVARPQVLAEPLDHRCDRRRHRAEVHRNMRRVGDEIALGVEHRVESSTGIVDANSLAGNWYAANYRPTIGSYNVTEGFAEAAKRLIEVHAELLKTGEVPELNLGQLCRIVRANYLVDAQSVSKVEGLPFTGAEIERAIQEALK